MYTTNYHKSSSIGVWFPAIRSGTGADVFTIRLRDVLISRGIKASITWLPLRAEFAPWSVPVPEPPDWANIIHINSWLHYRFLSYKLPVVATVHGCVHDAGYLPYKSFLQNVYHRFWIKHCEFETLKRANIVTAVSQYTAQKVAKVFNQKHIFPIHNWIDIFKFEPGDRKMPHTPFRLLFVGKPSRRKGVDLFCKIMDKLGCDYELRFTGTIDDLSYHQRIPENIIPIGYINDEKKIIDYYKASDILFFPTRLEGFGLVALEAQACGLPVVSTKCSSLPEVVKHGKSGILCKNEDISYFVNAIKQLKENKFLWHLMRKESRRQAVKYFNEDIIANKYISLYKSAISTCPHYVNNF